MKRISATFALLLSLSACGTLQRSGASGYSDWGTRYRPTMDQLEGDARMATEALSGEKRELIEIRSDLRSLENRIVSDDERRGYFRIKPLLASDQERIEYLKLPDRESRQRWLRSMGAAETKSVVDRAIASAVDDGDIVLGMPKTAVLESWGDPMDREVAGNPELENERWTYFNFVNSPDGYQREARVIYFESGRVVGWENKAH